MTAVLVTGASGTTGRLVAARLAARGVAVRAASRSGAVRFDWYDPDTHAGALAGADRMYLVPPVRDPDPQAVMLPFLDLARASGVRRAVLLSNSVVPAGGPSTGIVHAAIADTFGEWAVLRPTWFMQNVTGGHAHAISIRATSAIATSAGGGRAGFVDAGDIADVAVDTLLAPAAVNMDLILTGPQALSYDDVAAILTEISGHAITHKRLDPAGQPAYYQALGVPELTARFLVGMDWVIASGAEDCTTDTVKRMIGTPPRSFRDFAVAEFPPVTVTERADAARNRQAILAAASTLFDMADDPLTITMDDVAAAAGVGKGTLFRRFGDRTGLLRAVFDTRIAGLTAAITGGPPPLGPATPPRERLLALLDAMVEFKLGNRKITRALEQTSERTSFLDSPNYLLAHALFTDLFTGIVTPDRTAWTAHALLSFTRIDLLENLITTQRWTAARLRQEIQDVARILGPQ